VLEQLLQQLTGERVGTGYHVADLQRRLTEAMTLSTVIVLDEVEFLLLNDGNDLIYFLSRLDNTAVITVSATYRSLSDHLDARTFSSFQPQVLTFDPYSVDETIEILADRARQALQPQSLHRAALVRIASTTQNIGIGLAWLRVAAESTDDVVTADLVDTLQPAGYEAYVDSLLREFTPHHRRLYKTIDRLERFQAEESPFVTGTVYDAYHDHCETTGVTPLSERRVSDFLTHLELLDLIEATYHHGGTKGKTREISLVDWTITPAST
jgi:Cdc6-like AAA superfamily ATPase